MKSTCNALSVPAWKLRGRPAALLALQATRLREELGRLVGGLLLPPNIVYDNTAVRALAARH